MRGKKEETALVPGVTATHTVDGNAIRAVLHVKRV